MKDLEIIIICLLLIEAITFAKILYAREYLQIPGNMKAADGFTAKRNDMIDMFAGTSLVPETCSKFFNVPWVRPLWRCLEFGGAMFGSKCLAPSRIRLKPRGDLSRTFLWMGFTICCFFRCDLFGIGLFIGLRSSSTLFYIGRSPLARIYLAFIRIGFLPISKIVGMCLAVSGVSRRKFLWVSFIVGSALGRHPFKVSPVVFPTARFCPLWMSLSVGGRTGIGTGAAWSTRLPISRATLSAWLHATGKIKYKLGSHIEAASRLVRGASSVCCTEGAPIYMPFLAEMQL